MNGKTLPWALLLLLAACGAETGGSREKSAYAPAGALPLAPAAPLPVPGAANVHRLGPRILSGGEPRGEEAMRAPAALGVRTLISVDGKVPAAGVAARYGMRYVHVPIRYLGLERMDRLRLARIFREPPGPIASTTATVARRRPSGGAWS